MIVIHPYKSSWPVEFVEVKSHLAGVLGDHARHIAHIGSTAVPGLGAKDIIDVQIGVRELAPDIASKLSGAGYEFVPRHGSDHVPEGAAGPTDGWRKLFFRGGSGQRPCHIHVRVQGSLNYSYALLFRDYLRAHPGARVSVELVKCELARLHPDDADAYYAVKDPVYDLIWQAAGEWARSSGWRLESAREL